MFPMPVVDFILFRDEKVFELLHRLMSTQSDQ